MGRYVGERRCRIQACLACSQRPRGAPLAPPTARGKGFAVPAAAQHDGLAPGADCGILEGYGGEQDWGAALGAGVRSRAGLGERGLCQSRRDLPPLDDGRSRRGGRWRQPGGRQPVLSVAERFGPGILFARPEQERAQRGYRGGARGGGGCGCRVCAATEGARSARARASATRADGAVSPAPQAAASSRAGSERARSGHARGGYPSSGCASSRELGGHAAGGASGHDAARGAERRGASGSGSEERAALIF